MKDFEYYDKKPENNIRLISQLERFEIFNLEDAEKYDTSQNIDFIIDDEGELKFLVVGVNSSKFSLFSSREFVEIPWSCVTKVGANVIVISAERGEIKRARV